MFTTWVVFGHTRSFIFKQNTNLSEGKTSNNYQQNKIYLDN